MKKPEIPLTRPHEIRLARGYKLKQVADACDVESPTIQKIERGPDNGGNGISGNMAPKLAEALQVSVPDLYAAMGSPIPALPAAVADLEAEKRREIMEGIDEITLEELTLIDLWRELKPDMRRDLLMMARTLRKYAKVA